ncbi:OB-fold protein [Microbacterium sp. PMB16]|uniref:OB-fold protein n=1 Tax=Microbacterium sp. PMB16 TaxID=3120157 RepID=UPI003F4BC147
MMDIDALYTAFEIDRRVAEAKYVGQIVTVEGVVLRAGESMFATPAVEVSERPDGELRAVFVLPFDRKIDESFRQLESIRRGQRIAVAGELRMVSDPGGVLVFKNCEILEPERIAP